MRRRVLFFKSHNLQEHQHEDQDNQRKKKKKKKKRRNKYQIGFVNEEMRIEGMDHPISIIQVF